MKILTYILRHKGGVGRVIRTLEPELKKLGHELEIVSREDDLNCFSLVESVRKLNKDRKKRDYDILLTNDWSIALPFKFNENHFSLFHGLQVTKTSRLIQKMVGRLIGKNLMVVGKKMSKIFPRATLTENGVNLEKFFNMNKERKYLGWIKRDYDLITEAEARLKAEERGLELSVAENIHPDKMNEWYNSLEVFISMPPEYTGFNLCWVEAFRAGVQIILGNNNGVGIKNIRNEDLTSKHQAIKINEVIMRNRK